jgi:hypothetical protein
MLIDGVVGLLDSSADCSSAKRGLPAGNTSWTLEELIAGERANHLALILTIGFHVRLEIRFESQDIWCCCSNLDRELHLLTWQHGFCWTALARKHASNSE